MTTSASAASAAISSGAARRAPWCTTTRRSGVKRAASAVQLPTTAGGAITSAGASPLHASRCASITGVLPRPMSSARQPPSPAWSRNPSQPSASHWYERSWPTNPSATRTGDDFSSAAAASRSEAQPPPTTSTPPRSGDPSMPSAMRSISAPDSSVVLARSASASAAAARSARSISTHRSPLRISGRASLASSRISAADNSTPSNTADQRTLASWLAPTCDSAPSTKTRNDGAGLRRDIAGTRTSKPAASSCGPVTDISSHASSWLTITSPRR